MGENVAPGVKEIKGEKVFPTTMRHWNRNVGCVIDTETTGLTPGFHEIIQIAIIPFDSNFNIVKECPPFICEMKPDYPERISADAMNINKKMHILANGISQARGADLFEEWFRTRLGVYANKYGNANKIMPLGHNFPFDQAHMRFWLGHENYEQFFHYHFRDSMIAALAMNDHAGFNNEEIPYPKVSLQYLANTLHLKAPIAHDAIEDAKLALECYKSITTIGKVPTL